MKYSLKQIDTGLDCAANMTRRQFLDYCRDSVKENHRDVEISCVHDGICYCRKYLDCEVIITK